MVGRAEGTCMSLLSPSLTLVLILILGAAIHSSPLFPRSFINLEAPEGIRMMDKRSYNTFPNVHLAYGFDFSKIRGKTAYIPIYPYIPQKDWGKWRSRAGPMKKLMVQPGPEANYPRGMKQLMAGGLGGMGGWFLRKYNPNDRENPMSKDLAVNKIKSPASARFGVSYGRG